MEGQMPTESNPKLKLMYWIAAAAMLISIVLDVLKSPNWYSIGGRVSLVIAMILLATAKPVETHGKKVLVYALCGVAIVLLILKIVLTPR